MQYFIFMLPVRQLFNLMCSSAQFSPLLFTPSSSLSPQHAILYKGVSVCPVACV